MIAPFDREPLPQPNRNLLTDLPAEVRHEILGYSVAEKEPIQLYWDSHNRLVPKNDYMYKTLIWVCLSVSRDLTINHLFLKNNTFQFDSLSDAWCWIAQLPIQYARFVRSLSIPYGQGFMSFDQIFMRAPDIRCLTLDISPLFYLARFWWDEEYGVIEMQRTPNLQTIFDHIHYKLLRGIPPIKHLKLNLYDVETKLVTLKRNIDSAAEVADSKVPAWLRRVLNERYTFLRDFQKDFGPLRRFEKSLEAVMRLLPRKRKFECLYPHNGEANEDDNPRFQEIKEEDQEEIASLYSEEAEESEEPEGDEKDAEEGEEEDKNEIPMLRFEEVEEEDNYPSPPISEDIFEPGERQLCSDSDSDTEDVSESWTEANQQRVGN